MDTFQDYLESAMADGIIDFSLRAVKSPEGLLDFYIHPAGRDGDTGDFHVSGSFVTKMQFGAGSSRGTVAPLIGSESR